MTSVETGRRICIVMMSAIGDAVHVLPVVAALKRNDPASRITWILQPGPAALVRGHPDVDEILIFDNTRGWRGMRDLRAMLAQREFDLVIDLQVYIKAGLVTMFTHAPVRLGFDRARARDLNWLFTNRRIPPHTAQHVQDQYLEFLGALDIPAEPLEWKLGPWASELPGRERVLHDLPRPFATLVVGATHTEKEWIPERWAAVANALRSDFGLEPVIAGGRTSRELETARLFEAAGARTYSTLGVPLRELVTILDASELVISLDTAPLHMSVALERPVISLMGYNNPKRVGPYRRYHDLIVDAYGDPGEDYPITYKHRLGRMQRITVQDVLERVQRWSSVYRDRAASTRS
ncbi:MAG: glycosyltransferase family 9 protein [Gemmatimonadota bacterium]